MYCNLPNNSPYNTTTNNNGQSLFVCRIRMYLQVVAIGRNRISNNSNRSVENKN